MPLHMKTKTAAVLLACAGLQACGLAAVEGRQSIAQGLQAEMRQMRALIEQEVGDASAERAQQCAVLPVGERACGGPQAYVVYSTVVSDERKLRELARQYTEAEQKYNRISGTMSTCSAVVPPEVQFERGKCTGRQHRPERK